MRPIFEPYDEYERLARNRPHQGIADHLPRVTEGTLSSTIIKQPRRVIQQMPTGKIKYPDEMLAPILQVLTDNIILPNAITGGSMLQKGWESTSKALTYGSQPILSFYTQHGNYFGADCRLPYIRDVYLEKGQLCSGDSKVLFLRSWYTKAQLQSIIKTEQYLMEQAKSRGEKYKSTWDLKALAKLIGDNKQTSKDVSQQSAAERERGGELTAFEIVTGFQEGVDGEFYSFAPALENKVVRTKPNTDRRGVMPINYQFHTVDGGSPNGRGAVEHSGPVQNLLDSQLQGFQYNMALIQAPPTKVWGDLPGSTFKMEPDAIWRMGDKQAGNDAVPVTIATQGIQSFPDNFGMLKSILITGLNGQDTSISASVGNPGFSKTAAGVKLQQSVLGVDDNYIRKQYETCWGQVIETMLNIHLADSAGKTPVTVEGDQLEKLAALYPELNDNGGRFNVVYEAITDTAAFEVDASTSAGDDDTEQSQILDSIITKYGENEAIQQRLQAENWDFSIGETLSRMVIKSGVQDPEKIIHKLSEAEIQEKEEQAAAEAAAAAGQGGQETVAATDGATSDYIDQDDATSVEQLRQIGLDDSQVGAALEMLKSGMSADDVMAQLMPDEMKEGVPA